MLLLLIWFLKIQVQFRDMWKCPLIVKVFAPFLWTYQTILDQSLLLDQTTWLESKGREHCWGEISLGLASCGNWPNLKIWQQISFNESFLRPVFSCELRMRRQSMAQCWDKWRVCHSLAADHQCCPTETGLRRGSGALLQMLEPLDILDYLGGQQDNDDIETGPTCPHPQPPQHIGQPDK